MKIFESNRSLNVYKKLITVLGDYSTNFPATGVSKLFNQAVANGKKLLPTDKLALNILWYILTKESSSYAIHKLLNMRFSDLHTELQPLVQDGRSKEVAFWVRGVSVGDKVKDLIDFADTGKKGTWGDVDGGKVKLIDITIEEK